MSEPEITPEDKKTMFELIARWSIFVIDVYYDWVDKPTRYLILRPNNYSRSKIEEEIKKYHPSTHKVEYVYQFGLNQNLVAVDFGELLRYMVPFKT